MTDEEFTVTLGDDGETVVLNGRIEDPEITDRVQQIMRSHGLTAEEALRLALQTGAKEMHARKVVREMAPIGACPRCWGPIPDAEHQGMYSGAMSRLDREMDDTTEICSACGQDEGMGEFTSGRLTPFSEWPLERAWGRYKKQSAQSMFAMPLDGTHRFGE